jgi:hypothetical protein
MTDVKFDLQELLRDMEARLSTKVDAVHTDVKKQNSRVVALEVASERHETRGKWLVRTVGAFVTALLSYMGLHTP